MIIIHHEKDSAHPNAVVLQFSTITNVKRDIVRPVEEYVDVILKVDKKYSENGGGIYYRNPFYKKEELITSFHDQLNAQLI